MLNINFNLRNANSSYETPLNIIIRYRNNKIVYSSGLKVKPTYWNFVEQLAKQTSKFPEYPEFNTLIKNLVSTINQVFMNYLNEHNNEIPTIETFKHLLDVKLERVEIKKHTFLGYFQKYIANLKNKTNANTGRVISLKTASGYQNTLNILNEFRKETNHKVTFETIDIDFYYDFIEYLSKERKHSTNTIGKIIKNIKVVLNDATENGHNKNLAFKSKRFIPISEKSFSIYLNEAELTELYNLDLTTNKKLDVVRDLFLIGCYTGLRQSDWSKVIQENIDISKNLLHVQTQKTDESVVIPLHPIVNNILKKYNYVLPKNMSNQKINEYLKELGKKSKLLNVIVTKKITKAGKIEEKQIYKHNILSSHCARRSFSSNLYLAGFPVLSIRKITGHKSEQSFLKYVKITPQENANLLQLHWNKETTTSSLTKAI